MVNPDEDGAQAPLLPDGGAAQPEKRRSTLLTVCPFILGNEFCERLAYYGLSTNLVIYLTRVLHERPAFASIQLMLFEGTCYVTPIMGAWLADSRWGRYKTILVFSAIYFLGMVLLALSAWVPWLTPGPNEDAKWYQTAAVYGSLYIVALGTGGIKPNVSAFGADQFDESDPQDRKEKRSFFNWFYFAINIGSFVAVTCVVYIQETISWAIGFAIPAAAMAVAVVTFVGGSSLYTHVEPTESPMTRVVKVLAAALRARWAARRRPGPPHGVAASTGYTGPVNLPPSVAPHPGIAAAMAKSHSYQWIEGAIANTGGAEGPLDAEAPPGEGGVAGFSAEQVEEVRMVVRMTPVFLTTIFYWTIYSQMGSFFVMQGAQMDREVFGGAIRIPAATMALFNTAAIILLIPVYDRVLIPLLRACGLKMSLLQRIGWGLLVNVAAMGAAAGVEWVRLARFREGRLLGGAAANVAYEIVDMSVFWQIPQYLLIGLSEVLASIGQLEFFYDQAPDVMRSCSMALQLLSVAVGSYLSSGLVAAVASGSAALGSGAGWLPQDLNAGRLDLFFLLLAGLSFANLALFGWVALRYQYKDVPHAKKRRPAAKALPPRPAPAWARPHVVDGIPIHRRATPSVGMGGAAVRPEEDVGLYGRSVTYIPDSPSLPPMFR